MSTYCLQSIKDVTLVNPLGGPNLVTGTNHTEASLAFPVIEPAALLLPTAS